MERQEDPCVCAPPHSLFFLCYLSCPDVPQPGDTDQVRPGRSGDLMQHQRAEWNPVISNRLDAEGQSVS